MAAVLDVKGTEGFVTTAAQTATYTGLTTSSVVTNGAIIVTVVYDTHVTASSATWDGVAMTLLASRNTAGASGRVEVYGLAPITGHTGNKTFSLSWTSAGSVGVAMCGTSWSGVDQTGGTTSFPNATNTGGSITSNGTVSESITSAVGDVVVAVWATDQQGFLTGTNNTNIFTDSSNFPALSSGAANYASGAATVSMTGTIAGVTGTCTWAAVGVDILAAAGGAVSATQPRTPYVTKLPPFPFSAAPPQAYNLNLYSVVVVNTPFNQTDFPKAFDIPLRPFPLDQALNINLFTNPYPFNQVDWSKPIKLPQAPVNPDQSLNVNVFAVVPTPFIPIDWNKPFVPKFPPTIDQALNVNLFTNPVPVLNLDLFTPIRTKGFPDTSQAYNVNLYGVVVVQVPFNQIDWAKPFVPRPAPMRDQLFNPNVFTNPLPFNQFDFNIKPLRTPQAPVNPDQSLNINLFTNQYPFLNVFGLSTKVAGLVPPPQPYNQNIYTVVVTVLPFNTYDYPRAARLPRAPYDLSVQVNPNLFTNPFPFNQYDWAKAVRVKNVHSQPPYNQGLYNVVVTATLHVVRFIGNVGSMLVR